MVLLPVPHSDCSATGMPQRNRSVMASILSRLSPVTQ